jgi:hypothetical protein
MFFVPDPLLYNAELSGGGVVLLDDWLEPLASTLDELLTWWKDEWDSEADPTYCYLLCA